MELIYDMSGEDRVHHENEGYSTNIGSVAWNTTRKAEKLTNTSFIPFLATQLEKIKNETIKRDIYFTLGKIGENTGDKRVVGILLKRLEVETNKYTLEMILDRIYDQEEVPDCTPVLKMLNDHRWQVRYSAISVLGNCKSSVAEDTLIKIISESQEPNELSYALGSLWRFESTKAIPYIIPLIKHPIGEVRCSAIIAINELGDSSYLPLFIEAMTDRSPRVKYSALVALQNHGDESAIDVVYKRIKMILSRKRKIVSEELVIAFEFLKRYKEEYLKIQELLLDKVKKMGLPY